MTATFTSPVSKDPRVPSDATQPELLTLREVQAVILAALRGNPDGLSEEGLLAYVGWAEGVRIGEAILKLVAGDKVALRLRDDGEMLAGNWPARMGL